MSGQTQSPIIQVTPDDFLAEGARDKLMAIWKMANDAARNNPNRSAIIYIDEVDFVVGNREKEKLDAAKSKALSNLLAILDGAVRPNPYVSIAIIMTTNHPEKLDSALLRPGRIDKRIFIGLPNTDTRISIFKKFLPKKSLPHMKTLVAKTEGLSTAHIINLIQSANRTALVKNLSHPDLKTYFQILKSYPQSDRKLDLIEK